MRGESCEADFFSSPLKPVLQATDRTRSCDILPLNRHGSRYEGFVCMYLLDDTIKLGY